MTEYYIEIDNSKAKNEIGKSFPFILVTQDDKFG
jgi:hypothetical protein